MPCDDRQVWKSVALLEQTAPIKRFIRFLHCQLGPAILPQLSPMQLWQVSKSQITRDQFFDPRVDAGIGTPRA